MASTTPNIGLTIPTGTEKVSRQIINDNNTIIDGKMGAVPGGQNLQGEIDALNSKIETVDIGDNFTSLSALETALNTFGASLENQEIKNIYVYFNSGASPFSSTGYIGSFVRLYADRYRIVFEENASDVIIIGSKNASGWNWNKLTLLKSGENSIGNVICAGYNTGSGNYVDFFIPFDTNGKTITSVSISSASIVFLPAARVEFTNAPTVTVLGTNDNGIRVEIQYSSTQTANVCAIVYAVNVKVTCS